MSNYLFLLLVLACPLMMVFMMRGGHGHGAGHGHGQDRDDASESLSTEELKSLRDRLDRQIADRESAEAVGVGAEERELAPTRGR